MLENKRSVTNKQLLLMVDELEMDPILSHGKVLRAADAVQAEKWEQLVGKLNAVPNGAKRSVLKWKSVLTNWKLTLKKQAKSNENVDIPEEVNALGQRLLRLMQEEELLKDIDIDMLMAPALDNENLVQLEPPELRMAKRRARAARAGLRREPYLNQAKKAKMLKLVFDNNVDRDANPHKKIMQMQLDRLQSVSQQLESHIADVQNRIQTIKDMWQHECFDE